MELIYFHSAELVHGSISVDRGEVAIGLKGGRNPLSREVQGQSS